MDRTYWDPEVETRPWGETVAWQVGHLPAYVRRLQERSLLYRDRLAGVDAEAITTVEHLAELPTTEKDDLRRGQAGPNGPLLGLQQAAPTEDVVQVITSSGTTGGPVYFGLTAADLAAWRQSIATMYFTAGVRRGTTTALSTAMPMVAGGMPYADGIRETGSTLAWIGGQTTARMASAMERLRVDTLVGTASFASFFADKVTELLGRDASTLPVRTVVGGGEPGFGQPEIRSRIQELWGANRVSEVMGLGDVCSGVWGECEAGEGMHLTAGRHVLVEIIDPATGEQRPWVEGGQGEAVYTTFTREATPVLRFRSRDHIVVTGTDCSCGRRTPRIRCIGRTDDMLIYKAMNVFPASIRDIAVAEGADLIDDVVRVRKSAADQVRFDEPIPVELQTRSAVGADVLTDLAARIEERVRQELRVRVAVEAYPPGTFDRGMYKNALTYVAEHGPQAVPLRS
ncbi:hypothetical protein KZX45_12855 [Georgenia sp. EYE_87]|uniref:phenylacetate--CoA ligase family protein n=1 Tax=Georgenia sp. EYE_87 TaxID=2853448 RepID=UPI00200392FB|nr:AMP-binding protein [Georgenia sp. EYE_87]MCK6211434.1 hypothetical protein [Georgenia sp. EYE_87]